MDIQSLLHNFPYNLIIAALIGALLVWIICGRSKRRALQAQRESADSQLSQVRRDMLGEIDTKNDDIAALENRLTEADHLTQNLGQKANLLANEQQRYADLKDRYLNDVGRARDLLKTRGDATAELERRNQDFSSRYDDLHQRWDSERKRYAKLVTEKNQQIADLESRLEGALPADSQDVDPSLHSYSHGQLESMLVDLRLQVSEHEQTIENLNQQLANSESAPVDGVNLHDVQNQVRALDTKIASKDREISRLRQQLLQDTVSAAAPLPVVVEDENESESEAYKALKQSLEAKEAEVEHLKLEVDRLQPAAARLRRQNTQLQQLVKGEVSDDAELKAMELELDQLHSRISKQQADARLSLEKQANAFQRQLNAKTDTISRLNRQLQSGRC